MVSFSVKSVKPFLRVVGRPTSVKPFLRVVVPSSDWTRFSILIVLSRVSILYVDSRLEQVCDLLVVATLGLNVAPPSNGFREFDRIDVENVQCGLSAVRFDCGLGGLNWPSRILPHTYHTLL